MRIAWDTRDGQSFENTAILVELIDLCRTKWFTVSFLVCSSEFRIYSTDWRDSENASPALDWLQDYRQKNACISG